MTYKQLRGSGGERGSVDVKTPATLRESGQQRHGVEVWGGKMNGTAHQGTGINQRTLGNFVTTMPPEQNIKEHFGIP